jgi:hypothetical protein
VFAGAPDAHRVTARSERAPHFRLLTWRSSPAVLIGGHLRPHSRQALGRPRAGATTPWVYGSRNTRPVSRSKPTADAACGSQESAGTRAAVARECLPVPKNCSFSYPRRSSLRSRQTTQLSGAEQTRRLQRCSGPVSKGCAGRL